MSLRQLYYSLPHWMRFAARRIYFWPHDAYKTVTGERHPYEPPKGRIFTGSGDFIDQGTHQLALLKHFASLKPHHDVLDIGSGIGRTAVALTGYLDPKATYHGFDIVLSGVKWCQDRISRDFPNFHFTHVPLGNDLYKARNNDAQDFTFPYPDESFDVVFSLSVFTHMLPAEISNYLKEISRTLKPRGRCLSTFFLYDSDSGATLSAKPGFAFPVDKGYYRLMSNSVKSANVAIHEPYLLDLVRDKGLVTESITHGYWNGEKSSLNDFQDIIVFSKPPSISSSGN